MRVCAYEYVRVCDTQSSPYLLTSVHTFTFNIIYNTYYIHAIHVCKQLSCLCFSFFLILIKNANAIKNDTKVLLELNWIFIIFYYILHITS